MTSKDVIENLKLHFAPPAHCFLEQVADGPGARQHRWADGVAMSVWPSRGYSIHGIEVKVSRYDWLNELKQPAKSAAVQTFCNRWWIATPDEKIIQPGELPETWGWMVCKDKGMRVVREAPALTPAPISIEFLASILRNVQRADESALERMRRKGYEEGFTNGGKYERDRYVGLKKSCEEFERASGIKITEYSDGDGLGEAVATLHNLKYRIQHIESAIEACADIGKMLAQVKALASLREIKAETPQSTGAD